MDTCTLCANLGLENSVECVEATKGVFICYDCIETLNEVMEKQKAAAHEKLLQALPDV